MDTTATPTSWTIDPAHANIEFGVRHLMISTVKGRFTGISGTIAAGERGFADARIDVTIDAKTIDTREPQRDTHLRSADFFDVDKHPHATLTVTSAHLAGPAVLECQGTFEAAGHVGPVTFTARIQEAAAHAITLSAELELDRSEFAMTWSPLHMASMTARGIVTARFTRSERTGPPTA